MSVSEISKIQRTTGIHFFEISKIQRPKNQTSKWGILIIQIGHFDARENRGRPKGGPKILVCIYVYICTYVYIYTHALFSSLVGSP